MPERLRADRSNYDPGEDRLAYGHVFTIDEWQAAAHEAQGTGRAVEEVFGEYAVGGLPLAQQFAVDGRALSGRERGAVLERLMVEAGSTPIETLGDVLGDAARMQLMAGKQLDPSGLREFWREAASEAALDGLSRARQRLYGSIDDAERPSEQGWPDIPRVDTLARAALGRGDGEDLDDFITRVPPITVPHHSERGEARTAFPDDLDPMELIGRTEQEFERLATSDPEKLGVGLEKALELCEGELEYLQQQRVGLTRTEDLAENGEELWLRSQDVADLQRQIRELGTRKGRLNTSVTRELQELGADLGAVWGRAGRFLGEHATDLTDGFRQQLEELQAPLRQAADSAFEQAGRFDPEPWLQLDSALRNPSVIVYQLDAGSLIRLAEQDQNRELVPALERARSEFQAEHAQLLAIAPEDRGERFHDDVEDAIAKIDKVHRAIETVERAQAHDEPSQYDTERLHRERSPEIAEALEAPLDAGAFDAEVRREVRQVLDAVSPTPVSDALRQPQAPASPKASAQRPPHIRQHGRGL